MEPVPGFAVLVELGDFLFFVREEAQRLHDAEGVGRKDVPDIFRHDVGDEQINFVGLVGAALVATAANVVSAAHVGTDTMRRLDLYS